MQSGQVPAGCGGQQVVLEVVVLVVRCQQPAFPPARPAAARVHQGIRAVRVGDHGVIGNLAHAHAHRQHEQEGDQPEQVNLGMAQCGQHTDEDRLPQPGDPAFASHEGACKSPDALWPGLGTHHATGELVMPVADLHADEADHRLDAGQAADVTQQLAAQAGRADRILLRHDQVGIVGGTGESVVCHVIGTVARHVLQQRLGCQPVADQIVEAGTGEQRAVRGLVLQNGQSGLSGGEQQQ